MTVLTIGKKNQPWLQQGIDQYQKRLRRPFLLDWQLISPHPVSAKAPQLESQQILKHIPDDSHLILLDETGKSLSTPQLTKHLQQQITFNQSIYLVIGGAFGVSQELKDRANLIWSLSPLVFPHQLVRLILVEQIYRSQTIYLNQPYHHK